MKRVVQRCGLACAISLICASSAQALPGGVRDGSWLAAQLQAGHRVVMRRVAFIGAVNLNNVPEVRGTFECHSCVFKGPVTAHDVVFDRLVDLAGSRFDDAVDFTGARFDGPALFRAALDEGLTSSACRFRKDATFALAAFEDVASFGETDFCGEADFRDARFSDATFSHSSFGVARFERAAFRGSALFNDVTFAAHASFEETDFRTRADFARSEFENGADFGAARFGGGASLLATTFSVEDARDQKAENRRRKRQGKPEEPIVGEAALFQDAVSGGDINLTFAQFERKTANFSDFLCGGSLNLDRATFIFGASLNLERLQARALVLDVEAVDEISDRAERLVVLREIEDSAKARGDVGTANDAHYRSRELMSEEYGSFRRGLDLVFYRGVAGYLVRPFRPLLVLLALAAMFAALRMRELRKPRRVPSAAPRGVARRLWSEGKRRCATFAGCLLDSLARAGPRWKGRRNPALYERLEVAAYRSLVVCALIGLANSNPTLRDMLDSLL
jgi:uncharacterized protein YjbI with pentapeptide repeats